MNIVILNGSNRKNGATARVLLELHRQLKKHSDTDVQIYHVSDLHLQYCTGCCQCYRLGKCIFEDDIEQLSLCIERADGVILGSPTYASNVSGQLKTIIDRGHFVVEQLLHKKYAVSVATYENYGGKDTLKILNKLLSYSGASISGKILLKIPFSSNPLNDTKLKRVIQKRADRMYRDINKQHRYLFQAFKRLMLFYLGIRPFVLKKGKAYKGVTDRWKKQNSVEGVE